MNKTKRFFGYVVLLLALLVTSCNNKDVFDEDDYKDIVEREQPVEKIDEAHTWTLTTTYYMTASIPETAQDVERLLVLSANPANGESATVLGEYLLLTMRKRVRKSSFLLYRLPFFPNFMLHWLTGTELILLWRSIRRPTATSASCSHWQRKQK